MRLLSREDYIVVGGVEVRRESTPNLCKIMRATRARANYVNRPRFVFTTPFSRVSRAYSNSGYFEFHVPTLVFTW